MPGALLLHSRHRTILGVLRFALGRGLYKVNIVLIKVQI